LRFTGVRNRYILIQVTSTDPEVIMQHAGAFVLYALSQIRRQEIERASRDHWQHLAVPEPVAPRRTHQRAVRLDTVARGC
jgi:hypothetical protein